MRIGFIGLGSQGAPMARRIVEAGYDTTLWARRSATLESFADTEATVADSPAELAAAMGDSPRVHAVLLQGSESSALSRLGRRESGHALAQHLERSRAAAAALEMHTPDWVHRVSTDNSTAADVGARLLALTGWAVPENRQQPNP